jgi:hypothetical protein
MRERYCKVCTGWHDIEAWPHNCLPERNWNRSEHSAPHVITDAMAPVQSQLDGKMYDSKAALRRTYKQAGVIEVGNDSQRFAKTVSEQAKPNAKSIKDTVHRAVARFNRGERVRKSTLSTFPQTEI